MIKLKTIGMLDVAKNNPVLKSQTDVDNYSFIEDDGDLYVIMNEINGDDAYKDVVTIPAGEYLNGFLVKAWEGQVLVVDEEHIEYDTTNSQSYATLAKAEGNTAATLLAKKSGSNKLEIVAQAPNAGVYFKVVEKTTLVGNAVELKVMVA